MENKDHDLQQYNSKSECPVPSDGEQATATQKPKRKVGKIITLLLILAIVAFSGCLCMRWFWICNIGVLGDSMKPNYNMVDGKTDVVWVNKTVTPNRGDVIIFYPNITPSGWTKFKGEFATGKDVQRGGEYEKYIKRVVAVGGDSIWWEKVDDKRCILYIKTADGTVLRENEGDNVYYRNGKQAQFYTLLGDKPNGNTTPYFSIPTPSDKTSGKVTNTLYPHDSEANAYTIPDNYVFVMGDNRNVSASDDSRNPENGAIYLKKLYGVVINP